MKIFFRSLILFISTYFCLQHNFLFADDSQFFGVPVYRVGPYAASGSPFFTGFVDYLRLVSARDGGINGVKISWEECETEYNTAKGLECYERLKTKASKGPTAIHPMSTGLTYGLIDKAPVDKIPLITVGYGRTDASDGKTFPWVFPLISNYWSQASSMIRFIGKQENGLENLKNKKIVLLYHDSAYGKEPHAVLKKESEKFGYKLKLVPVPHPGNEQQSQWLQIRRERPDWVILWGWGVMNATALKTAQKVGYPRNKMIGNWWAGSEVDTFAAGTSASKGYFSATLNLSGKNFPVVKDIIKYVYKKNDSLNDKHVGTVFWNRGVAVGMLTVEAVKNAQEKFGKKVMDGSQVRWGIENLNLDQKKLNQLGFNTMIPTIKVTCEDHEGSGLVRYQQWDGNNWEIASDWISGDKKLIRSLVEESSKKYAKEKGISRKCL